MLILQAKIKPQTLEAHQVKLPRIMINQIPTLYQLQKPQSAVTPTLVDQIQAQTEEVTTKMTKTDKKRKNILNHQNPQILNHPNLEQLPMMTKMMKMSNKNKAKNSDHNFCGHNKLKVTLQLLEAQDHETKANQ